METILEHTNYTIWNTPVLNRKSFAQLSAWEQLKYFVVLGAMAPNTHNAQPWAFFLSADSFSITVYVNRNRVLPASDKTGRQSLISIGCAIENIITTAKYFGKKCTILSLSPNKNTLTPCEASDPSPFVATAELTFADSLEDETASDLFLFIPKRKVMRADYDREKIIDSAILQKIKNAVPTDAIQLHLIDDPLRRQAMAEFQGQADSYVINSKKFSRELGEWLVPNTSTSGLGMPGIGFGLPNADAERIHQGLLGEIALEPEDGLKFALAGKTGMEKSPFIGFLTAQEDEPAYWIETGRTLQRIFLICTSHGIATAVHAGIVEVTLINRMFAATLGTVKRITAVFRMGYIKDQKDLERPHSPRLSVEEVLLTTKI